LRPPACLTVKFLTEFSSRPALAVFAFRALAGAARTLKQKHRSVLQVLDASKAVCLLGQKLTPAKRQGLNFLRPPACLTVKFLTEFSSRPGLTVFAFRCFTCKCGFAPQTKTSLRPSSPGRKQSSLLSWA